MTDKIPSKDMRGIEHVPAFLGPDTAKPKRGPIAFVKGVWGELRGLDWIWAIVLMLVFINLYALSSLALTECQPVWHGPTEIVKVH